MLKQKTKIFITATLFVSALLGFPVGFATTFAQTNARCARESDNTDRVIEVDCDNGYYTGHFDSPQAWTPPNDNGCYIIESIGDTHPSGAHDDFTFQEVSCDEFDGMLRTVQNNSSGNLEGDCDTDSNNDGSKIDPEDCGITSYLKTFINLLSAVVGIVIVIMFAVRGIQFSTAGDNAQQVTQAKEKMFWLVIALVAYTFSFAILQWLVPGGIF